MYPHPQSKRRRNRDRARKWRYRRRHFYYFQKGARKYDTRPPILWKPLKIGDLRYDKMSEGWAKAFEKWGIEAEKAFADYYQFPDININPITGEKNKYPIRIP